MVGESRFGGVTRGGFFGLMLVGGLVIGLFFIPELLQLRSAQSSGTSSGKQTVSVATEKREHDELGSSEALRSNARSVSSESVSQEPSSTGTSTSGVMTAESRGSPSWGWWTDVKDWFAGLTSPRLAQVARERETSRLGTRDDARASLTSVSQKLDSGRPGQATWASIRSQESKDAVGQARRDALELSRGLPTAASLSKFAMIDFANGLEFVMTRAEQQMTPRDAIIYLMKLDQSVSRALAEDRVDRVFVKRWSQISLGPVLSRTMLGQRHDSGAVAFDPQLTMTAVQVRHKEMRKGNPATGKVEVIISGYLIGEDIKQVTMEANDGAISYNLALKRDPRGFLFFNRGSIDGRLRWKFTVYDKFGEQYEKTYQFYPRVGGFRYDSRAGYQIPFRMARATVGRFRSQDFDPRMDQFFAVSEKSDQVLDANALFVTF